MPTRFLAILIVFVFVGLHARAEDICYSIPIAGVSAPPGPYQAADAARYAKTASVWLDQPGEAFVGDARDGRGGFLLLVRTSSDADLTGTIHLLAGNTPFKIPASTPKAADQTSFLQAKQAHYANVARLGLPGSAWFSYQAELAARELGQDPAGASDARNTTNLNDTFGLFDGSRAVNENLQLGRALGVAAADDEATIPIDTLKGITIREMDYAPLIRGLNPQLDPLASAIPADQHAVFFPSFSALARITDEADSRSALLLQLNDSRFEDGQTLARYQKQLGISMNTLGRLLGPQLVKSLAITGSDPYLRTGSDLAILFETADPAALETAISAQISLARLKGAEAATGTVGKVAYTGVSTPSREICSYLARVDNRIIVTNSLKQLERLGDVSAGNTPALAAAPEYIYYRSRYIREEEGKGDEAAFIMISDAAIRRWCSPRWRVLDSRRNRAMAVMSAIQAAHAREIIKPRNPMPQIPADPRIAYAGDLRLTSAGVFAKEYGGMDFLTPIVELSLDKVTKREAAAYEAWRSTYERGWTRFDPIAIRLALPKGLIDVDLSIMPLILGTELRDIRQISDGVAITAGAGDPHADPVHLTIAVNKTKELVQGLSGYFLKNPKMEWIGQTVSIYIDDGPFWGEFAKADAENKLNSGLDLDVPIGVYIDSVDKHKLEEFMQILPAQFMPKAGLKVEQVDYKPFPYTKTKWLDLNLYFAATDNAFIISASESLIQRAIDRSAKRDAGGPVNDPEPLGASLAMRVDMDFITKTLGPISELALSEIIPIRLREAAWSNLCILNEWKHLFPDEDPLSAHERLFGARLICPGGGTYVWNAQDKTMESTVFGHPSRPKTGPTLPPSMADLKVISAGLTFEGPGLRARLILEKR